MVNRRLAALAVAITIGASGAFMVGGCGSSSNAFFGIPVVNTGVPATTTFSLVQTTSLPGGQVDDQGTAVSASVAGSFSVLGAPTPTTGAAAPTISNSLASAQPGAPPKPIWIGSSATFNTVVVSVFGETGSFLISVTPQQVGNQFVVGLDLVTQATALGAASLQIQTVAGTTISAPANLILSIDPRFFQSVGDMRNDNGGRTGTSDQADLFGAQLQGTTSVTPQNINNFDNNSVNDPGNGIKGIVGPTTLLSGHREIVWDGVGDNFQDGRVPGTQIQGVDGTGNPAAPNFPVTFFARANGQGFGVQGGINFQPISSADGVTAIPDSQVNDENQGTAQLKANVGTTLGGDFSNVLATFGGIANGLIAFTQNTDFAPLSTTITDCTFVVAGTNTAATVHGMGVIFISVDKPGVSSLEYFDAQGNSLAKVFASPQFGGPYPFAFPNPQGPSPAGAPATFNQQVFPYSFAGFLDNSKSIARVRITTGDTPINTQNARDVASGGTQDIVLMDDVYFGEPNGQ